MPWHSVFMYPTNATTLIVGRRLICSDHDLTLFCPTELHTRQASTMPYELERVARSMGRSVKLVKDLDTLNTADFIIFPTLDVDCTEKRDIFAKMIKDCFQYVSVDYKKLSGPPLKGLSMLKRTNAQD